MTTHDVLRKARAYLLEHGWKQGGYGSHGGPRCALGSVRSCGERDNDLTPAAEKLQEILDARFPDGDGSVSFVPNWNDTPGRTLDDVIALFDEAILATAPPLDDTPIFQALESLPADEYIEALSVLALIPAEALA